MLTKISLKNAKRFCCEDISLIENYEQAIDENDKRKWVCHHKLGIELSKSKEELIEIGLYYNRPACELCFMESKEHNSLHNKGVSKNKGKTNPMYGREPWNKGVPASEESKQKNREKHLGKTPWNKGKKGIRYVKKQQYYWLTPNDEIKIMDKTNAHRHHSDWVLIGPA